MKKEEYARSLLTCCPEEMDQLSDEVVAILTDRSNEKFLCPKNTPRGMGFKNYDIDRLFKKSVSGLYSNYALWYRGICLYSGEGYLKNRIARAFKGLKGMNRKDEEHAFKQIYDKYCSGFFNEKMYEDIMNNMTYTAISYGVLQELKSKYPFEYASPLDPDDIVYWKHDINKRLPEKEHKAWGIAVEKEVLKKLGPVFNKKDVNRLDQVLQTEKLMKIKNEFNKR